MLELKKVPIILWSGIRKYLYMGWNWKVAVIYKISLDRMALQWSMKSYSTGWHCSDPWNLTRQDGIAVIYEILLERMVLQWFMISYSTEWHCSDLWNLIRQDGIAVIYEILLERMALQWSKKSYSTEWRCSDLHHTGSPPWPNICPQFPVGSRSRSTNSRIHQLLLPCLSHAPYCDPLLNHSRPTTGSEGAIRLLCSRIWLGSQVFHTRPQLELQTLADLPKPNKFKLSTETLIESINNRGLLFSNSLSSFFALDSVLIS